MSIYQGTFIVFITILLLLFQWLIPVWIWYKLCIRDGIQVRFWKLSWIYILGVIIQSIATIGILLIPAMLLTAKSPELSPSGLFYVIVSLISIIFALFIETFLLKKFYKIKFGQAMNIVSLGLLALYIIIGCIFGIRYFIASPHKFVGPSMEPTLQAGDIILSQKIHKDYKRGNIVLFDTEYKKNLVKRIAALPGEKVEIKDGRLKVCKDEKCEFLEEKYPQWRGILTTLGDEKTFAENDGYFLIGDNIVESADSRCFLDERCFEGKNPEITESVMKGKIYAKIWPTFKLIK